MRCVIGQGLEFRQDPERLAWFRSGVTAHPHIATIHSIEKADEAFFIAMKYVDGQALSDRIHSDGNGICLRCLNDIGCQYRWNSSDTSGITDPIQKPSRIIGPTSVFGSRISGSAAV